MSNLTPHQAEALRVKGHLALTANAGSGKTFILARRYLAALLDNNIDISNIAAITFTDKAASELYLKISRLIDERLNQSSEKSETKLLKKIRRQLVSANISTIHSFCINILREFPVEACLDARFTPIDENLSDELIELSVEETIRSLFDDNNPIKEDLRSLIRTFGSRSKLQNQLYKLIKNRKNVFEVQNKIYDSEISVIAANYFKTFCDEFILIWSKEKDRFINTFKEINESVLSLHNSNTIGIEIRSLLLKLSKDTIAEDIISSLRMLRETGFNKDLSLKKRGYQKKEITELHSAQINEIEIMMGELSSFELSDDHAVVDIELAMFGKIVLSIFDLVCKLYENKKRSLGYIDYEDILIHTKILLTNPDVKGLLTSKYKFILVDEFQDTNEIQYQIFLPILDYLKRGNLFIVGDEKQSIYKFRDAEIEIFNLTRSDIKTNTSSKNLLSLPDSFRMAPAICSFCNHIFKKLFANPEELYGEVPSTDLVCARNDNVQGQVELLLSSKNEDPVALSEAELVAEKIKSIISHRIYTFNDITILVRKRKHFSELEKVFLLNNIPFTIVGGKGFYQRQTISDVYNYLSFLVDESNNAALVGILRSPFFNLSDAEIFELSLKKGYNFWQKLVSAKEDGKYEEVYNLINENRLICDSISLPHLISRIITESLYLSIIAARLDGEQEIANISKLISIARNFNSTGFRNIYDFLEFLKDSITDQSDESQAAIVSNSNAVQMMTIHQSKGLEFPVVFIYKTNESGLSDLVKSGEVKVDKKYGLLTKVPVEQNYLEEYKSAPIVNLYNYIESKKNNAELKRLFYVAITRAKDCLFLTGTVDERGSAKKDSFYSLLKEGLNSNFNVDSIKIKDRLDYLRFVNEKYENFSENFDLIIPITRNIEKVEIPNTSKSKISDISIKNINSVLSFEKGEIISASKVAIYNQCPLKYLLTYEYGFKTLNAESRSYKSKLKQEFVLQSESDDFVEADNEEISLLSKENEDYGYDKALYGKIFHKIMEHRIDPEKLSEYLDEFSLRYKLKDGFTDNFKSDLYNDIVKFRRSKIYEKMKTFSDFKNEFEIYVKERDYYLHGILDKIVFDGNKLIIYDYKTDNIELSEIKKHSTNYLIQLKFYLYIASRLFKKFHSFEGNLVFIKHPDKPITISYCKEEIGDLELEINKIIMSIRSKELLKNVNHCKECTFSGFTKNCIIN